MLTAYLKAYGKESEMDQNKILAVTDARKELYSLVKGCKSRALSFVLTSNGEAVARLMSEDEYASLMETLEILSDRVQIKRLAKALKHVKEGKLCSHEDVFGHPQHKA